MSWYCWGKPLLSCWRGREVVVGRCFTTSFCSLTLWPYPPPPTRLQCKNLSPASNQWLEWEKALCNTEHMEQVGPYFVDGYTETVLLSSQWPSAEYNLQWSKFEHRCRFEKIPRPIWLHLNWFDTVSKCPYFNKYKSESNLKKDESDVSSKENLVFIRAQKCDTMGNTWGNPTLHLVTFLLDLGPTINNSLGSPLTHLSRVYHTQILITLEDNFFCQ